MHSQEAIKQKSTFIMFLPIIVFSAAMFVMGIDLTVMNVSISTLVKDLNTTVKGIQIAIALYALVMAAFMLTGAKLGSMLGFKKSFTLGICIYGIGAIITSLSPDIYIMILGWSCLQGFGAAIMMPSSQTLIRLFYTNPTKRAFCFSITTGMMAGGAALGPIIGGVVTTYWTWRWIFRIEAIIAIIVFIILLIVKTKVKKKLEKTKFDLVGMFASVCGLILIIGAVLQANTAGWWTPKGNLALFGISIVPYLILLGILCVIFFAYWEHRALIHKKARLVNLNLFKNKEFVSSLMMGLVRAIIQSGLFFIIPLFLQMGLGYNPLRTGLILLPASLSVFALSFFAPLLLKIISAKRIIQFGLIFLFISVIVLYFSIEKTSTGYELIPGLFILGIGIGLIASQVTNISQSVIENKDAGDAFGLINTFRQFGMSAGTALIGALMIGFLSFSLINNINSNTILDSSTKTQATDIIQEHGGDYISNSMLKAELPQVPEQTITQLTQIESKGRVQSLKWTLLVCALITIIAMFISIFLPKKKMIKKS